MSNGWFLVNSGVLFNSAQLQKTRIHNEKTITVLHETTRVSGIPFFGLFAAIYAVLNALAFLLYADDKKKAQDNAWRTPENLLLFAGATGPFGAYGAMRLFRHKNRKLKFYLVPVFLLVHLVLIACIFLKPVM